MKKISVVLSAFLFLGVSGVFAATIKGRVSSAKLKTAQDILVYIEKVEGEEFAPLEGQKMDQVNLLFVPRVLPVVRGTSVEFHNSDDLQHNVFGVGVEDFDLGVWGKGEAERYAFKRLGEVAILSNVHPEMEAYIVVLQNPYFGLTNKQGEYKIEGVPAGQYTLKTWHDRLRPAVKSVTVPARGEINVDFELKR
ncbi:MAG: carboxypeptidase regulatory-like domain-containing protein [Candidatus Omnitrophota bacterium]